MTAEGLASAVGTTKAQILAYENGHRVPDPPRIKSLARALQVHPWYLMNLENQGQWTVADLRRACGQRASDVVDAIGVAPKVYRRFEVEGIVPNRRPQFLSEVARTFGVSRRSLEKAIDRAPAARDRRRRAADLVVRLAERYVPTRGKWQGPTATDPDLIELAALFARPLTRMRRVMTYELGELRQWHVRLLREQAIADFDTDRTRQAGAREAAYHWNAVASRYRNRIPGRLELFHRSAQPSDVWSLLVDLINEEAVSRGDGPWIVTKFLTDRPSLLPPHLVDEMLVDGVHVVRLSTEGNSHVALFAGLYAALYPAARKPSRATRMSSARKVPAPSTFVLSNPHIRLAVPQPYLDAAGLSASPSKTKLLELNDRYMLTINTGTLAVSAVPTQTDEAFKEGPALDRWIADEA
ncbi:helix-turn-helix domain-containing protein [Streptomyces sp. NPDC005576]|uniref:helix-turn-helix domain-containing protein n=1 Tax=Streptomyces sp. NPDC005576 TaxID=3364726 RepID=UPI00369AA776